MGKVWGQAEVLGWGSGSTDSCGPSRGTSTAWSRQKSGWWTCRRRGVAGALISWPRVLGSGHGPHQASGPPASPATTVITQTASNPLQGLDRQASWGSVLPLQQENRMVRALQEVMGILTVRIRLVIHGAFSFTDAISLSHHHGL